MNEIFYIALFSNQDAPSTCNAPLSLCLKSNISESQTYPLRRRREPYVPSSAEYTTVVGLKGPSPLLLKTPTFTSKGAKGRTLSFLNTYLQASGEASTVSIQMAVPYGRKATTYPKPLPFCSSSGTVWEGRQAVREKCRRHSPLTQKLKWFHPPAQNTAIDILLHLSYFWLCQDS